MRNAEKIVVLVLLAMATDACHRHQQEQAQNTSLSMDEGIPENQVASNADVETLPPDESSATPSNQLASGFDNPDVNDLGNSGNSQ